MTHGSIRRPALNPIGLHDYSLRLADAVGAVLDRGEFAIVLGGDCSSCSGARSR
jgi:arginase